MIDNHLTIVPQEIIPVYGRFLSCYYTNMGDEPIKLSDLGIKDKFSHHERCLQEGVCPNGCGPLEVKSYTERACPKCGFRHCNANPDREPHATS